MNLVDRALLTFAPDRAVKRSLARLQHRELERVSAAAPMSHRSETRWRGASRMLRSLASWTPTQASGRGDLPLRERGTLVARSYDAYRNHMLARAAITRCRTNVVGTGLIAHPAVDADVLGLNDDAADALNTSIAGRWAMWADNPLESDVEATSDFYALQTLALGEAMLAGDCFALTPFLQRPGGLYGLKVQMVDGARVSNPDGSQNTKTLIDGVEVDPTGMPVKCLIRRRHPADTTIFEDGWDAVPVFGEQTGRRRVMHVWNEKDRIGSMRGVPYLAPIIEPLQTLEQYGRYELLAAAVQSLFTVFLEKESQELDEAGAPVRAFPEESEAAPTQGLQHDASPVLEMGPAAILELAPGEKSSFANPSRPNSNYDPFFLSMVKQIGAALELPVDELLLHYQSSYSAARAAMLQAWRFYTQRRWILVQQFCAPIYRLWFDETVARGLLPVSGYDDPMRRAAYTNAIWVGPARGSMDELKEAQAAAKRIETGVSNETIETAAMAGEDWRVVHRTRQRELKARQRDLPDPARTPAKRPAVSAEEPPDEPRRKEEETP